MNNKIYVYKKLIFIVLVLIIISFVLTNTNKQQKNFEIINAHEHIQNFEMAEKLIQAMDPSNIKETWLLGSPNATLYKNKEGFSGHDENNEEVIKIVKTYPNRFKALCTINPEDPNKLEKFKQCIEKGSRGLKLYSGHSMFYTLPLNDTSMLEVYEFCEKNNIPILFHVNAGIENYKNEFEDVLKRFPNLIIICPHFCLSSIKIERLKYLLDTYPNLYTDVSFGFYAKDGLGRISKDPNKFKNFITKYQDRFLFGTDMVVTDNPVKTAIWITDLTMCYRDMLEKETYECMLFNETLNGLALDEGVLEKIYEKNPSNLIN